MANRQFRSQFHYSFDGMPVRLQAQVTFGASGAPTLSTNAKGIATVVRNSAGKYTITLRDSYNALLGVSVAQLTGTSAAAAPIVTVVSQAVSNATPTLVLQYRAIDNSTATDPASGEIAYITITLNNSSV
jgi:hypothetical protein